MKRHSTAGRRDERGVVLVLTAIGMVAVLAVTAIVVDLGRLRQTRREAQSAADLAAMAAGFYLSGGGGVDGAVVSDPRAACRAALNSLWANVADLPTTTTLACDSLPATGISPNCTNADRPTTLVASASSPYTVSIEYPVPESEILDPRFKDGVGFRDMASDGDRQCERMQVSIRRTNGGLFSGIVGINSLNTGASSVMRADTRQLEQGVAALLLLERLGCGVLQTSGGGSSGAGVVVQASGPKNPGTIQADSVGHVGPCTTNENATGYVVYGTPLPAAGGGGPSITAQASSNGTPGVIGMRSLQVGGRGGAVEGTGIFPAATPGSVLSRSPADLKYNKPAASGGAAQISSLHLRAYTETTLTAAQAASAGYTVLSGNASCNGLDTTTTPVTATKVFFDCPNGFTAETVVLPQATTVTFSGNVSVPNNKLLSMPIVQHVYVRGCTSGCSGGNGFSISVAGELRINTGGDGTTAPSCTTRSGPGSGGTNTNWTELATLGGPFLVTNQIRMCQTFVYLGENRSTYLIRTQPAVMTAPENYPAVTECSTDYPCPSDSGGVAAMSVTGGSGSADWTAPNQLSHQPSSSEKATYPFEDLALWTEASTGSFIKGQGASRTEGVFFTPNSAMTFTGQATQSQPLNAQFISRTLNVSGQGTLNLKPSPEDSIQTPLKGTASLIR